jgi:hypothetical protein
MEKRNIKSDRCAAPNPGDEPNFYDSMYTSMERLKLIYTSSEPFYNELIFGKICS